MKILYIVTEAINIYDFVWAFKQMGHDTDTLNLLALSKEDQIALLTTKLKSTSFDFIITNDFFPIVSNLCQAFHIPYVSWNFDAPFLEHYGKAAHNSCNYMFTFDKSEYDSLQKLNLPHLYHSPLCINPERLGALEITPEDEKNFQCDISFVGSLYDSNIINHYYNQLNSAQKAYLNQILYRFDEDYSSHLASESITLEECNVVNQIYDIPVSLDEYKIDMQKLVYNYLLARKATELDRIKILNHLASKYHVTLFTQSPATHLKNVHVRGQINYETDMNKVFYLSKINLNISLRSIATGIPQRVMDIMGCGGFVLTNNQAEISDYFTKGVDLEVFSTLKELSEIVEYYLHHERERLTIAMNGYKKVCAYHTYQLRAQDILKVLKEEKQR